MPPRPRDGKPVAICRLKRVAADHKDDITHRLPKPPAVKNGKKVALIGAGPAALTVANDLMPLGYQCTIFEKQPRPGGLMRINIPAFRLPEEVLDEEIGYIVNMGVDVKYNTPVASLKSLADSKEFDASSSAAARRRARSSICPAATRPIRSSSASSGWSRSTSATQPPWASAC